MAATKNLTWLAYRRRRWLAAFAGALLALAAWQVFSPREVDLVVYNDGVGLLTSVQLTVDRTNLDYGPITPGQSLLRSLPAGVRGELVIWLPETASERVAGPWVDSDEVAQVVVRVGERGTVTTSVHASWSVRLAQWLR